MGRNSRCRFELKKLNSKNLFRRNLYFASFFNQYATQLYMVAKVFVFIFLFNGFFLPYTHSFFFFFPSFFFFFFFGKKISKISKLQIKIANQSGTYTMPKHATFHPPMHSYHVFHRRVERPSTAGIGCAPEVALKNRRVLQNVGHRRRFSESKE